MSEAEKLDPKAIPEDQQARRQLAEELKDKAQAAFERGELLTASLHASDLLMLYPNERAYLEKFDEIVLSTEDPLALLPVASGSVHVATAAGRARVLMMQRRLPEALSLLCRVVDVAPDVPYVHWIGRWLQPQIVQQLPWDLLAGSIVRTAMSAALRVPVPPREMDPRTINLRAAATIFETMREVHPDQAVLWYGESLIRRRLSDPAANVALAEAATHRFPQDWRVRVALLNAYRDDERPDEALVQARAAMAIDPADLSPLHDAAWAMLDGMRNSDAVTLFEELHTRDPSYPGAKACMHYSRWLTTRGDDDRLALVRMRERNWWDRQIKVFTDEVDPPKPFLNVLPGPGDATAAAARHLTSELARVIECCGSAGTIDLTLGSGCLESPSVQLAFDLAMKSLGAQGTLRVEVAEVQSPDPRLDKAQLSTRLWQYEGTDAKPVYPTGDVRAQEAIASLARQVFGRDSWDAEAAQIAASFGNEGYHALVSVLTYPPLPPPEEGIDPITWTWRCQVATAVTLSHLGPWATGSARAALYSMVYGPSDWITSAAIIAFGWRAHEDPAVRAEVEPIFAWLRTVIPEKGYTPWEIVLAEVWLGLGGHSGETMADLRGWIARYDETIHEKNVVRPPERRYGGLNLEDYARFSAHRDRILSSLGYQDRLGTVMTFTFEPPAELAELCQQWNVPLRSPQTGGVYPFITEWQEAMNANPSLHERFIEHQRTFALEHLGVSAQEKAALDEVLDGRMDMHQRMAQAQTAQRELDEGGGDSDPDPVVFPGQPVEKLSDYVAILKGMQGGDMMGALAKYGLDMMSYTNVAQAWGAKLAADPSLTERFTRMMG